MPKIVEPKTTHASVTTRADSRKMDPPKQHSKAPAVVVVVLLILMGAGVAAYFFYKKRRVLHVPQEATFENTLYFNSHSGPGPSDTKGLVGNIEQNEHAVI